MIAFIDNYDSFVHNLARYVRELGGEAEVWRNDEITVDELAAKRPSHLILSPGPCTPREAGISNAIVEALGPTTPILGVCLGHQCIGAVFGGRVVRATRPMHGKTSLIHHDESRLFESIPSPFRATRYHSLIVERESLPASLALIAWTERDEVMAVRHRDYPVVGVQFHPESVLTQYGHRILRNFLEGFGP